ncbi:SHOCT domain-containing protein [Halobacillus sp. MO56]
MMIILFLFIAFLIYTAANKNGNGQQSFVPQQASGSSEAIDIAKNRLSKGEITVEEFEQLKKNLL